MQNVIVRISPITSKPVLFFPDTADNGRLQGFTEGQQVTLGVDYYDASAPLELEQARAIVKAYASAHNIDEHSLYVRTRRPKNHMASQPQEKKATRQRKTNDSNLVLVGGNGTPGKSANQESNQDYRSKNEREADLAKAAQNLHDTETAKQEEQKATADNPEGAKVVRSAEEKSKRRYHVKSKKKSEAAMRRYLAEIASIGAENQTPVEEVKAAPNVTQEQADDEMLQFALKLARILKEHKGVL